MSLSQTSCLALLKAIDDLGKLYGGVVRPQWVMALLRLYELKVGDPFLLKIKGKQ